MFGWFKSDPEKKLRKQYHAKLEQAMHKFKQHHEMFMKKFTQDRVMWQ